MQIPARTVRRLARRLNWTTDDALTAIHAVTLDSGEMTPDDAASAILILNKAVTEMSPGMASVIILAAAYKVEVDDRSVSEAGPQKLQAV